MDEQVKIWQRVKGETPPTIDGLPAFVAGSLARAAYYGTLSRQMQGPARSMLLTMQEEEQHCARCLKGIYRMITGTPLKSAAVPLSAENTENALRKCYGQTLKVLTACNTRSYDPEYGPVFTAIGSKMRDHCCKLAELLGF